MSVGYATNAINLTGSGTVSGTTTGVTKAYGTNDLTLATTAFVYTELTTYVPAPIVGGGSWHSGGIALATSYTNSYGYPIHVSAWCAPQSNAIIELSSNGVVIDHLATSLSGITPRVSGYIPALATWVVSAPGCTLAGSAICY